MYGYSYQFLFEYEWADIVSLYISDRNCEKHEHTEEGLSEDERSAESVTVYSPLDEAAFATLFLALSLFSQ